VEDEVDGVSEPKNKKKKKKHRERNLSPERAECDLMADYLNQGKREPAIETQQKKRKRHLDDDREAAAEKNKKKKKLEGYKSVYHETPENEELHFTRLSSEDVEYGTILEDLKETYLKETEGDLNLETNKKRKKKKHKLHTDSNECKETVAEVAEDLEHAHESNEDDVVNFPVHAKKKNKKKREEKLVGDIPGQMKGVGLFETGAKQLEVSSTLLSFSAQDNLYASSSGLSKAAFPGTNLQKTDFNINDLSPKAKMKKVKHDSPTNESLDIQSKAETAESSQKSSVLNSLESNCDNRDENHKAKKKKRKEHDSNKQLLAVQMDNSNSDNKDRNHKTEKLNKKEHDSNRELLAVQSENNNSDNKDRNHKTKNQKRKEHDSNEELLAVQSENSNSDNKDRNHKTKNQKRKEHDSNEELLAVQSENSNFDNKDRNHKTKKQKRKEHDSSEELLAVQSENSNSDNKDRNHKTKNKKRKEHDSNEELLAVQSENSNSDNKDRNHKTKKQKRKEHDSIKELLAVQSENDKFTVVEESAPGHERNVEEHGLGSHTHSSDKEQGKSVPTVVDLLNIARSMLKVKSPKKVKKEKGNKKHSGISDEPKTSSIPPHNVQHRKGKKHDNLKLDNSTGNGKSTQKDSSKSYAGLTDGLVSSERQSEIKIPENKDVGSINAATLLENGHIDGHDGTKSDECGSHVSTVLHVVESKGVTTRNKEPGSVRVTSHHNKKQHETEKLIDKASVSFDPAAKLAEYMSKWHVRRYTQQSDVTETECSK
jgi:hypothetical protein